MSPGRVAYAWLAVLSATFAAAETGFYVASPSPVEIALAVMFALGAIMAEIESVSR